MYRCKPILFIILSTLLILFPILGRAAPSIHIKGISDNTTLKEYIETTVLPKYQTDKINTYALKQDTQKALKAKGYYAAEVNISNQDNKYSVKISAGSVYRISTINIIGHPYNNELKITIGDILNADDILTTQKDILNSIKTNNCYYSLSVQNEIVLDHTKHLADVTYRITVGTVATFGNTHFTDLKTIDKSFIQSFVVYKIGECWDLDKVEETKTALMNTNLFSFIKTDLPQTPPANGIVDVNYDLEERLPRSVRFGVNHQSDLGPGFLGTWSHRNIMGAGEELSFDLRTSAVLQSLKTDFYKPHIFGTKQSLTIGTLMEHKNTDAFEELNFNVNTIYKHKHSKTLTTTLGFTAGLSEITDETDDNNKQTFGLISFPGTMTFDDRDNKLDTHQGIFAQIGVEPFGDILGRMPPFYKLNFTNSIYLHFGDYIKLDPVLAFRTNLGSILGNRTSEIPAPKRHFSGGGNSVRGVEFQHAGPLKDGDPTGGRSLVELSSELRVKFNDTIGLVTFIDAGNVYDQTIPNLETGLFLGAGIGARYYTSFGPIRLDVAVPINKREEQREKFQFYISIGQAF